jgi:hypothetical protein
MSDKKLKTAKIKSEFKSTIESVKPGKTPGQGEFSAKPLRYSKEGEYKALKVEDLEAAELLSPEKEASDLADKALNVIGKDKSDKAEAIRQRALLIKAKKK